MFSPKDDPIQRYDNVTVLANQHKINYEATMYLGIVVASVGTVAIYYLFKSLR